MLDAMEFFFLGFLLALARKHGLFGKYILCLGKQIR
jgi:hypothetical protein